MVLQSQEKKDALHEQISLEEARLNQCATESLLYYRLFAGISDSVGNLGRSDVITADPSENLLHNLDFSTLDSRLQLL